MPPPRAAFSCFTFPAFNVAPGFSPASFLLYVVIPPAQTKEGSAAPRFSSSWGYVVIPSEAVFWPTRDLLLFLCGLAFLRFSLLNVAPPLRISTQLSSRLPRRRKGAEFRALLLFPCFSGARNAVRGICCCLRLGAVLKALRLDLRPLPCGGLAARRRWELPRG
jgi:hypothetical protein